MPYRLNTRRSRPAARRSERGYVLLLMMLFMALLAIAAGALAPSITFQVRRDREEEMIHRGVQYSRAIRRYVKKFGRYPSSLEQLENTNTLRFLRKRYKDPITGQDFKLLHVGEVHLMGAGIAGAAALGAGPMNGVPGLTATTNTMLGGPTRQGATIATTTATATTAASAADNSDPNVGQKANPDSPDRSKTDQDQSGGGSASDELSSKIFGGGPIVGVASTSKAQSIREFNHKNHYHEWQFIYDPTMDRGGLITTPAQPPLQITAPIQQQNSSGMPAPSGGLQGSKPPPVQPTEPQQQ
jgi:type II secretory pathway pseudopilin PulG